jgi:hypothetical protein
VQLAISQTLTGTEPAHIVSAGRSQQRWRHQTFPLVPKVSEADRVQLFQRSLRKDAETQLTICNYSVSSEFLGTQRLATQTGKIRKT